MGILQSYSPENLLNSGWKTLSGIFGFGRSETDQLGTCKSEGSCDKNTTQAFKAVMKSAWISLE